MLSTGCWESEQALQVVLPIRAISLNKEGLPNGPSCLQAFCTNTNRREIPISEATLLLFVLNYKDLPCSNTQCSCGEHKYFMEASTPRLQQVMKGIQREQATMKCQRVHKPITITIMPQIEWILSKVPLHHNLMVWAACCTAYFGFLRSSEFTVPYRRLLTSTLTSPLKTWQVTKNRFHHNKTPKLINSDRVTLAEQDTVFAQSKQWYHTWRSVAVNQLCS